MRNSISIIRKRFADHIRDNGILPGERIPPERELALELNTSRTTLRKVLQYYESQGYIEKRNQGGTFLSSEIPMSSRRTGPASSVPNANSRLISVMLVGSGDKNQEEQNFIHNYLQSKNFLMNLYITTVDRQDPALERQFFESLLDLNVKGVLALPTPIRPANTEMMRKLEHNGIHLAHIGYYRYELPEQAFFLEDYECAGRLAVERIAGMGCQKLIFNPLNEFDFKSAAPFMQRLCRGIKDEAEACGLEIIPYRLPHSHLDANTPESRDMCRDLPKNSGIITCGSRVFITEMRKAWQKGFRDIPIVGIGSYDIDFPVHHHVPTYGFSRLDLLKDAINYLIDPETFPCHKLYKPTFRTPS